MVANKTAIIFEDYIPQKSLRTRFGLRLNKQTKKTLLRVILGKLQVFVALFFRKKAVFNNVPLLGS
jgi:hypothetical protein